MAGTSRPWTDGCEHCPPKREFAGSRLRRTRSTRVWSGSGQGVPFPAAEHAPLGTPALPWGHGSGPEGTVRESRSLQFIIRPPRSCANRVHHVRPPHAGHARSAVCPARHAPRARREAVPTTPSPYAFLTKCTPPPAHLRNSTHGTVGRSPHPRPVPQWAICPTAHGDSRPSLGAGWVARPIDFSPVGSHNGGTGEMCSPRV